MKDRNKNVRVGKGKKNWDINFNFGLKTALENANGKSNDEHPDSFFDLIYQGNAPWYIGKAQPALNELFDKYPLISIMSTQY